MDTRNVNKIKNKNIETLKVLQVRNKVWEKEKVYYISWYKVGQTNQTDKTYSGKLYDSYKIVQGKIVPEGTGTGFYKDLQYYINTSNNTIKKFDQCGLWVKELENGSTTSIIVYDIYDGQIYWRYKK